LTPDNVSVLEPACVSAPVLDTTPEYETASLRLKTIVPELTTLSVAIEPVVDPAPTLTVPAEIVRAPVNVFAPDSVSVPAPDFVSLPLVPSITPAKVVEAAPDVVKVFAAPVELSVILAVVSLEFTVAIEATVSLKPARSKVPLFEIDSADVSAILFEAPSASTPADTVVVPV